MASAATGSLSKLYTEDETAWLEAMAETAGRGDVAGLDLEHLSEYLTDMALRDRGEVKSRLVLLLTHVLKWDYQKERRTRVRRRNGCFDIRHSGGCRRCNPHAAPSRRSADRRLGGKTGRGGASCVSALSGARGDRRITLRNRLVVMSLDPR